MNEEGNLLMRHAIVGAGLAGLVAIIELYKKAITDQTKLIEINVIEKRSLKFNRRQKIILTKKESLSLINKNHCTNWDDYCNKNLQGSSSTSANKKGRVLSKINRQRDFYQHPFFRHYVLKNTSIKELQFALLEQIHEYEKTIDNVKLNWHLNSQITEIDITNKQLTITDHLQQSKLVKFDTLLNCEGTKQETTILINQSMQCLDIQPFVFSKFNFPIKYHCAVRLKLSLSAGQSTESLFELSSQTEISQQSLLAKFAELGYLGQDLNIPYVIDDNYYHCNTNPQKELRLFVASMIPQCLHEITDSRLKKESIIQWAKLIAAIKYNLPESFFEFDSKGEEGSHQINALTFENELVYASKASAQFENGIKILLVGDAFMTSYYPAAISALFALNEACLAVKVITEPTVAMTEYEQLTELYKNELANELENSLRIFSLDAPAVTPI